MRCAGLIFCALIAPTCFGQAPPDPDYVRVPLFDTYEDFRTTLFTAAENPNPVLRDAELDALFASLESAGQVPFAIGDHAAFLYRGSGGSVAWPGDYNGWSTTTPAQRIGTSDVWILEQTLPSDARTDYKLFLNGSWLLDPRNPLQQWGGFGPNSEFRMPDYIFPQETVRVDGVPRGDLTDDIRISSDSLGFDLNYRVYTPPGYDSQQLSELPTIYVTDGHEYLADYAGAMPIVMDNLIAEEKIRPAIAVFIDPRDPDSGFNKRQELYLGGQEFAFVRFVAEELISEIDATYRTGTHPSDRTILGTSFGGFNSAVFGAALGNLEPEYYFFQNIAMQSPWLPDELIEVYRDFSLQPLNIFLSGGTLNDDGFSDEMAAALAASGYSFEYLKVNEGHSWGAWRGQLDEVLIAMVGPAVVPEPASLCLIGASACCVCLTRFGQPHRSRTSIP